MMNVSLRLGLVASLCVGLTGCADALIYGGMALGELLYKGTVGYRASVQSTQLAQADGERCREFTGKGIEVTEPLENAIPTNEGEVRTFEATIWRSQVEGERYPQRERREPVVAEGTLAITERSVLLVPSPGTAGVRIPYEVVRTVEVSPLVAYSMTVKSCTGRFDIFSFWERQTNKRDPEAAAAAAAQLKTRVAAFQATTREQTESPQ